MLKRKWIVCFLVLCSCGASDSSEDGIEAINDSEAALWSAQTLVGAEIGAPELLTSADLTGLEDGTASVTVYRSQVEFDEDFPEVELTMDFTGQMILVAGTPSTGGCFTGAEIPRVAETDSALQVFLRSDYTTPDEATSGCTADIREGVNIFYSSGYSEKTVQTVAYICTDAGCSID